MRSLLHTALLFAAVVLATPFAQAQVCEGNVTLTTQAEVNAFDCVEVIGNLEIGEGFTSDITTLSPLAGLSSVSGSLSVSGIQSTSLDGLGGLSFLGTDLDISYTDHLTNLNGLIGLDSVRVLSVFGNSSLEDLSGLAGVAGVYRLHIGNNNSLTSLDGLDGITGDLPDRLKITGNISLTNLEGLAGITGVGQDVEIRANYQLTSLDGLDAITAVGGSLYIRGNTSLTNLEGLTGITSVGQDLRIGRNPSLASVDGLANLISVGRDLELYGNHALTDVDGFANVTSIGRDLWLSSESWSTRSLTNVDGFAGLTSVGRNLYIVHNPDLAECTVGLSELLINDGVLGWIDIRDNAPGCNSVWEAMGGSVDAEDEATPLVTGLAAPYPNPTVGAATLSYSLAEPSEVTLTLYDALGRRVRTLTKGPQSAGEHEVTLGAGLPAGTYVVRFEAGGEAWTERVTVIR